MKAKMLLFVCFVTGTLLHAQNNTDISLLMADDTAKSLREVVSASGDMYNRVWHHGPAVENEWVGYRFFFNYSTSIDVYSKTRPGLELKKYKWYPSVQQQNSGAGVDMYKVGKTLGLGGVVLWDNGKIVYPDPVKKRIAKVGKGENTSWMEMISVGVPYKGDTVDIKVKVTVFSGRRDALVEAEELNGRKVQFVTGINCHPGNKVIKKYDRIIVWGVHPEDVAAHPAPMGAAIIYDPECFIKRMDDGNQILLISKPVVRIHTRITSANSKEKELNNLKDFKKYVKKIKY